MHRNTAPLLAPGTPDLIVLHGLSRRTCAAEAESACPTHRLPYPLVERIETIQRAAKVADLHGLMRAPRSMRTHGGLLYGGPHHHPRDTSNKRTPT
jgi:hypothetical protein